MLSARTHSEQSTRNSVDRPVSVIGADQRRGEGTALSADDLALKTGRRIVVVMPAFNAATTMAYTWSAIPREWVEEVIVVDDGSRDNTIEIARTLPVQVIAHPHNVGYGGNQKTCYMEALRRGADVIVMLHPDGQYDPSLLPDLVRPILRNEADIVLGSRFLTPGGVRRGGMPLYKIAANRSLTALENIVLRRHFAELHTGYRAYSRRFLETVPFLRNSNDFVFDSEVIAQAVAFGFPVAEVPVSTNYFPEASSTSFRQGVVYGLKTLRTMGRYLGHRSGFMRSRLFHR